MSTSYLDKNGLERLWEKIVSLVSDKYSPDNPQINVTGSSGSCTGNSATATAATKATNDSKDQQIDSTYIKDVTIDGEILTITKGDGQEKKLNLVKGNDDDSQEDDSYMFIYSDAEPASKTNGMVWVNVGSNQIVTNGTFVYYDSEPLSRSEGMTWID